MSRRPITRIVKPLIGSILLVALIGQIRFDDLAGLIEHGQPWRLAASFACFVTALFLLQALRLHVLVRHYTGDFGHTLRLFLVTSLYNQVLPSGMGGDVVRLVYLQRMRPGNWLAPLGLLVLHRLSGLVVLWVAGALYVLLRFDDLSRMLAGHGAWGGSWAIDVPARVWAPLVIFVVALAAFLRLSVAGQRATARLGPLFTSFRAGFAELDASDFLMLVVLSVSFHAVRIVGFWLACLYLGQAIGFGDLVLVLAVAALVALLPISIGGLGVLEASIAVLLGLFGVDASAAVAVALIQRIVLFAIAGAGGVLYLVDRKAAWRPGGDQRDGGRPPDSAIKTGADPPSADEAPRTHSRT